MHINVKFEYIEKYLPTPRCRKYRTREVKGICTVTVREAPIGKLVRLSAWNNTFGKKLPTSKTM